MLLAFYVGQGNWVDSFVRTWTRGAYSHVECVFDRDFSQPVTCGSSSSQDHGVRIKQIQLNPANWRLMDVPAFDSEAARAWFQARVGQPYDWIGLLSVCTPVRPKSGRWQCVEAVGGSVGEPEAWRYNPTQFARICELHGGRWLDWPVVK